jgi:hypothetical protein
MTSLVHWSGYLRVRELMFGSTRQASWVARIGAESLCRRFEMPSCFCCAYQPRRQTVGVIFTRKCELP